MWHLMVLALDGRISELGISAILNIIMGVCWLLVYILVIIRASSDKTYAMPYAAMCANFSWELFYAFVLVKDQLAPWWFLVLVFLWLLLDVVIVIQYLKYGSREDIGVLKSALIRLFIGLTVGIALNAAIWHDFNMIGVSYSAFIINFMMSDFFVAMLVGRGSSRGQSEWIAVLKLIGTLAASIALVLNPTNRQSALLLVLAILILIFDAAYIYLLYHVEKEEKPLPAPPVPA